MSARTRGSVPAGDFLLYVYFASHVATSASYIATFRSAIARAVRAGVARRTSGRSTQYTSIRSSASACQFFVGMLLHRAMAASVLAERARCKATTSSSSCVVSVEPSAGGAAGRSAELLATTHVFHVAADSSVSNRGPVGASRHVATSGANASTTIERRGAITARPPDRWAPLPYGR